MFDFDTFAETIDDITKVAEEQTTPAELVTALLPHQERVVDRMRKSPGLVVAHGTGSGKTFTSIAAAVKLRPDHVEVLVPAALQDNYKKEIRKHTTGDLPVRVGSLQKAVVNRKIEASDLLIVDEAHKARDPKSKTFAVLRDAIPVTEKRMLLTASPVYNKPEDVAPLVNLAAGDKVLPTGKEFEKKYISSPDESWKRFVPFVTVGPGIKNKRELRNILQTWVDYHKDESGEFPDKTEKRIRVAMTKEQTKVHNAAQSALPPLTAIRMKRGLPPNKQDLSAINKFESQSRQASVSMRAFTKDGTPEATPKVQAAAASLARAADKNPNHRALVYSNYLASLDDYEREMERRGIPVARIQGGQKQQERRQIVSDFNSGKVKALLVSSAGGEGFDLKGTRQVQILEPHWNDEKLRQVIGRAIRHKSHSHLPEEERSVKVERYIAAPRSLFGMKRRGVEDYLQDMSDYKSRLNDKVIALMAKKAAAAMTVEVHTVT